MGIRNQFLASNVLCIICLGVGIIQTWPSSTIQHFSLENTTLSRPMTEAEQSLFGSLSSIGAMINTPISGYLLDKIGRKYLAICIAMMHVMTWIIRIVFTNVEMMLFSCILAGMGGTGMIVVGVFISEFAQESVRGALTSMPIFTSSVGMLISYWIGSTLDYRTVNYIYLSLAVLGVVSISFLMESPTHLMRRSMEQEAAKSISFYRSVKVDSQVVSQELDTIRRALNPVLDEYTDEDEKLNPKSNMKQKLSTWQFIKKSSSTRRAFGICFILALLTIFQGLPVVQVYAAPLFKEAVPNVSSTLTTVLFAVVSLVAAVIAGYLTDVAGRRTLLILASLAGGVCCVLLGSQLQLTWGPHWLTAVLLYLYSAAYTFGPSTIPLVLTTELFLPEIKGLATVLIVETIWMANFLLLFIFNPLVNSVGLPLVFYIFASISFVTAIVTFITLPETKGLPVDKIQSLFKANKENYQKRIA